MQLLSKEKDEEKIIVKLEICSRSIARVNTVYKL